MFEGAVKKDEECDQYFEEHLSTNAWPLAFYKTDKLQYTIYSKLQLTYLGPTISTHTRLDKNFCSFSVTIDGC